MGLNKVSNECQTHTCKFVELKHGRVFSFEGKYYIKSKILSATDLTLKAVAVNLETGDSRMFNNDDIVVAYEVDIKLLRIV